MLWDVYYLGNAILILFSPVDVFAVHLNALLLFFPHYGWFMSVISLLSCRFLAQGKSRGVLNRYQAGIQRESNGMIAQRESECGVPSS